MKKEILGVPFKQFDKFLEEHGQRVKNTLMRHIAVRCVDILKKRFSMFERNIRFGRILNEGQLNVLSPELQAMVPDDDYFIFGDVIWYSPTEDKYGPGAGPAIVLACHTITTKDNRLMDLGRRMYTVRRLSMTDVVETYKNGWLHDKVLKTEEEVVMCLDDMEHIDLQVWALRIQHYSDRPSSNAEMAVIIASILRIMFLMEYSMSGVIENFTRVDTDDQEPCKEPSEAMDIL